MIGVEQPTMAALLARMERDGVVVRTPHPSDRRSSRFALSEAQQSLEALRSDTPMLATIAAAGKALADALQAGNRVYSCGNGGSMCDAMHFAEELSGRFRRDRPALAAQAISDVGHMSCVANDFGYAEVFSRYIEAHGRPGDVLLAISTSGKSPNILMAAQAAKDRGMRVIGLSAGGWEEHYSPCIDVDIRTPGGRYADRVQELHIKVIHILIEIVERHLGYAK